MKKTSLFILLFHFFSDCPAQVLMTEIYTGGGLSTGSPPWNKDVVVLKNYGASSASINGYSFQFAAASGTTWTKINLPNTSIAAGGLYFICLGPAGTVGANPPTCDFSTTLISLGTAGGKVALVYNTTTLSGSCPSTDDFVPYGTANCSPVTPATSATTSVTRPSAAASPDQWVSNSSPLPIELTRFGAREFEGQNRLNWQTASESNMALFEVQRSPDAIDWQPIAEVVAAGNSGVANDYTFTDETPFAVSYYRLRSVDFDGAGQFSAIERVVRHGAGNAPSVLPTIVEGEATLLFESDMERESVTLVFDWTGRLVFSQNVFLEKGENRLPLGLGNLPKGQYFLKMEGSGGPACRFVKI